LVVFLPVTLFGSVSLFGALTALVLMTAAWEWARLLRMGAALSLVYAALAALLLAASLRLGIGPSPSRPLFEAASVFWLLAAPFALWRRPALAEGGWRPFLLMAGVVVFIACWHALLMARTVGVSFVLSLLLVVWLADIGAYFAGKAYGRRKLAVSISPGKTWEGAIGGWLAVLVAATAAQLMQVAAPILSTSFAARVGWPGTLAMLTVLVIFSVLGDLFESLLKRQAGVKDSSSLLPGHGGVLDRVDALLPVLPLAMLLLG